jgi:hypothetical protein
MDVATISGFYSELEKIANIQPIDVNAAALRGEQAGALLRRQNSIIGRVRQGLGIEVKPSSQELEQARAIMHPVAVKPAAAQAAAPAGKPGLLRSLASNRGVQVGAGALAAGLGYSAYRHHKNKQQMPQPQAGV